MNEFLLQLESFRTLEKCWDSYKADPPNDLSIQNAKSFLELCSQKDFLPYRVTPTSVGGVALTWKDNEEKVFIEFYNKGNAWYIMYGSSETTDVIAECVNYAETIEIFRNYFG